MKVTKSIYWFPEGGFFTCNTYLIDDEMRVLVDPGSKPNLRRLLAAMEEEGFGPRDIELIVNTHCHPDHCGANQALRELSGAKIAIHEEEERFLTASSWAFFGVTSRVSDEFSPDFYLGNRLKTGRLEFRVIHTPGHSPGSVCFYSEEEEVLICGDVVFEGSIGRTDLPGGDSAQLKRSIQSISQLRASYLLPGHMNIVVGRDAVRQNFELIKKIFFPYL